MYIIKNAYKSIVRAKGRNILIFILVFFISVSACIALSVRNSAEAAKETAYDSLSITAQITANRQGIMDGGNLDRETMMNRLTQALTLDELIYYAQSPSVDNFYYSASAGLNAPEGFEIYENASSGSMTMPGGVPGGGIGGMMSGGMTDGGRNGADITLIGYSGHDAMTSFINGENVILEGSVFDQDSADGSCVISREMAVLNGLAVGGSITLCNPQKEEQTYPLTVCGIFQNETTDSYSNTIFTSYASLDAIVKDTADHADETTNDFGMTTSTALRAATSATYVFYDTKRYESFRADVESMGLDMENYAVSSGDISQYEKSVVPLESLSKFTMAFLIVVLLIGGGILVIFNMFTVRERKYEIGVLAAIGMRKSAVAAQFLTETFLVTLLAVIIGSGVGAAASRPVGDYLLREQVASVETASAGMAENFGGRFQGGGNNRFASFRNPGSAASFGGAVSFGSNANSVNHTDQIEYLDSLNTAADLSVLLSLMAISILLTLAASSVGMISVLRYEPLKILSER